jgi:DNA-binding transcriptional ArsR family regulator
MEVRVAKERRKKDEEHADAVLKALNHQLRRRIMRMALGRECESISPTEAAKLLDVPLSNVSYHFRVLAKSGALEMTSERPVRGSIKHFYRANQAVTKMPMVIAVLAATSADD